MTVVVQDVQHQMVAVVKHSWLLVQGRRGCRERLLETTTGEVFKKKLVCSVSLRVIVIASFNCLCLKDQPGLYSSNCHTSIFIKLSYFMTMDLSYICDHQVGYSAGGYSLSPRWFLTWYIYPFSLGLAALMSADIAQNL